jgi:hypothetical protein
MNRPMQAPADSAPQIARTVLFVCFLANVILAVVSLAVLPERVAYQFGAAIFLFLLLTGLLTIHANLCDPVRLDERLFLPVLVLFLGYTVVWCIVFFRRFRL